MTLSPYSLTSMSETKLPHARERLENWIESWRRAGRMILLLDFDGTLAPIVEDPAAAQPHPEIIDPLGRLLDRADLDIAVVSGRGLADVRGRVGATDIFYAGNHGMEIEGPGVNQVHEEATSAQPLLEKVRDQLARDLADVAGAIVEDKVLTLSIHYRQVDRQSVRTVQDAVERVAGDFPELIVMPGKELLEIRPRVDWHKGRAVMFLLDRLKPEDGVPVIYIGDDRTDEDAFLALRTSNAGEGVLVTERAPDADETAAFSWIKGPAEVAQLLQSLAAADPADAN